MAFANKWAGFISFIGRLFFFLLIILQVPLFRVPCRGGICESPLELTSCHLIATEIWPPVVVKSLMYPRAVANAILKNKIIPSFNNIIKTYPYLFKDSNELIDLHRVEVLVGSYLSVAGAILGCLWPGRMTLAGTLFTLWGLKKDLFIGSQTWSDPKEAVSVYPAMLIAVFLAFLSIKGDVRRLIRCFRQRRKSKYL